MTYKSDDILTALHGTMRKMQAFAYLLGQQRREEIVPLNLEEIYTGLGEILELLCDELRTAAQELERQTFSRAQGG